MEAEVAEKGRRVTIIIVSMLMSELGQFWSLNLFLEEGIIISLKDKEREER